MADAAPRYPHVVRAGPGARLQYAYASGLTLAMFAAFVAWVVLAGNFETSIAIVLCAIVGVVLVGIPGIIAILVWTETATFTADEVMLSNAFGRWRIARSEVFAKEWQHDKRGGLRGLNFYRNLDDQRAFAIYVETSPPAPIHDWLATLPEIASLRANEAIRAVEEDPGFGANAAERLDAAKRERGIIAVLFVLVAAHWLGLLILSDQALAILVTAIVSFVLLVIATILRRHRWQFERAKGDLRPATGGLLFALSALPFLTAIGPGGIINWGALALYAVLVATIGVACTALLMRANIVEKVKRPQWLLVAWLYFYGTLFAFNVWWDRAPPAVHYVRVQEKLDDGLKLGAWGPYSDPLSYDAPDEFIDQVSVGEDICVWLYRGALGIQFYEFEKCEPAPA